MLPTSERLLLGPGPSPVSPRVMAALGAPPRSHLDPELVALLDDIRARLARVFQAGPGAATFAVSGTGTLAMEAAVANVTAPGAPPYSRGTAPTSPASTWSGAGPPIPNWSGARSRPGRPASSPWCTSRRRPAWSILSSRSRASRASTTR
jgi:hypothetical protein